MQHILLKKTVNNNIDVENKINNNGESERIANIKC